MCIRDSNNAFHFQVVRLCSNRLIESIYTGIMDLIGEQIFQTDGVGFYESHMKIFEAIRDRDPKRAAYYMADHFQKKFPNYQHYREFYSLLELSLIHISFGAPNAANTTPPVYRPAHRETQINIPDFLKNKR